MQKRNIAFTIGVCFTVAFLSSLFLIWSASPLDKSIVKQFVYDIDPTYPAVEGLTVDLYNSHLTPIGTCVTDANGYVTFANLVDQTYTIKWTWGGVEASESDQITCAQIVWDWGTNKLESKSGGGTF